ncbi:M20/M25/M40 family metallo-hydrolase [Gehongia tenuis]|uniref:M20/M25/M40 family metallo-hydrolase n=1 Tax=Gehongia tenuis TaxID=2763655 RepID=UPI002ED3A8B9
MHCPGVCDDTANLAVLMMMAKYVTQRGLRPKQGLLFVANSCEEGLGNLKGSRQIMKDYGERIQAVFSFDGGYTGISNNAVGSTRYRVEVKTEGGHSYGSFGNRNAIAYLASMIQTLYNMKVPTKAKTTFNVGMISGGTSVNTIAQQAEMLYEYRSEDRECLAVMERMFGAVVEAYRAMDIEVNVEILGQRPCKGDVDEAEQERLTKKCLDIVAEYVGSVPECSAGSTDCNIPLSLGIPAVCVGVCHGQGAHTREEWLEISSLKAGSRVGAALILDYFNL